MYTRKSNATENELILIETKMLEEKCGKCSNPLILKTYWSKKGHQQKIECSECGLAVWRKMG
ncbi:MAG: hypothetical protein GF308_16265 [Candidatus Heimdallarchaeota archaeon]|nr:hypothetical protein [Candidatus Heimdallarchaeota archaeon]